MNENEKTFWEGVGGLLLILLFQSVLTALIVSILWIVFLQSLFNLHMTFFHWFGILMSYNLIRIDIIKIIQTEFKKNENELRKRHTKDNR